MEGDAACLQRPMETGQGCSWIKMRFLGEKESFGKAAGQAGFQRRDLLCIQPAKAARTAGKSLQFFSIAGWSDDESPILRHRAWKCRLPPVGCRKAKFKNALFRRLTLAIRSQHAARIMRRAMAYDRAGFTDLNLDAATREFEGSREACNACAFDQNSHGRDSVTEAGSG